MFIFRFDFLTESGDYFSRRKDLEMFNNNDIIGNIFSRFRTFPLIRPPLGSIPPSPSFGKIIYYKVILYKMDIYSSFLNGRGTDGGAESSLNKDEN